MMRSKMQDKTWRSYTTQIFICTMIGLGGCATFKISKISAGDGGFLRFYRRFFTVQYLSPLKQLPCQISVLYLIFGPSSCLGFKKTNSPLPLKHFHCLTFVYLFKIKCLGIKVSCAYF